MMPMDGTERHLDLRQRDQRIDFTYYLERMTVFKIRNEDSSEDSTTRWHARTREKTSYYCKGLELLLKYKGALLNNGFAKLSTIFGQ